MGCGDIHKTKHPICPKTNEMLKNLEAAPKHLYPYVANMDSKYPKHYYLHSLYGVSALVNWVRDPQFRVLYTTKVVQSILMERYLTSTYCFRATTNSIEKSIRVTTSWMTDRISHH